MPIPHLILPWTGRENGDDSGYRKVAVASYDRETPDFLVGLNDSIRRHAVYAVGAAPRICVQYPHGLGASKHVIVRKPVNQALLKANALLRMYNRELLVLDGFRPLDVQRRLWRYLLDSLLGIRSAFKLSMTEFIQLGTQADDIGAYADIKVDDRYFDAYQSTGQDVQEEWAAAAQATGKTVAEIARLYFTFKFNLGIGELTWDLESNTAHGCGGAVDAILIDTETGKPTFLGMPFDGVGKPSALRYFEDDNNLNSYQEFAATDPTLKLFLRDFGITEITRDIFDQVCAERRLFYHCMARAGATHYVSECWHWNFGNEEGGNHFNQLPYAGGACHSILKNACDMNGRVVADWGNAYAQTAGAELLK